MSTNKGYNDNDFEFTDGEFDEEEIRKIKEFWETDKKNPFIEFIKKLWSKKPFKIGAAIVAALVVIALIFMCWLSFVPGAKMNFVKAMAGSGFGRWLVTCFVGDDYLNNMMDSEFNEDDITFNVDLDGDYTDIAIFGVDSRNNSDASLNNNADTVMVLSIDNETKEIKMASVYRDTFVRYKSPSGYQGYTKITEVYGLGGATSAVNALNENFDLNIRDYVTLNWNGLANIIDAFGGIDVNITEDEQYYINYYMDDLKYWTDLQIDYLDHSGNVHLTGPQATAYCRIRYCTFFDEEGNGINDDFGRTARQRHVIKKICEAAKNAGASKLLGTVQQIMKTNTGDHTFMKTSLTLSEVLNLAPLALEAEFNMGGQGFPTYYESTFVENRYMLCPVTTYSTTVDMHAYLYDDPYYMPSATVQEISDFVAEVLAGGGMNNSAPDEEETTKKQKPTKEHKTEENTDNSGETETTGTDSSEEQTTELVTEPVTDAPDGDMSQPEAPEGEEDLTPAA